MRHALVSTVCLVAASTFAAASNPDFDRAVHLNDELQYAEAAKALEAAWQKPGNDRATVLRILELQGVVLATLNQGAQATQAFQMLLSLEPDFKLKGDHPPRVTTAFFEAKGAIGEKGVLTASALPAAFADGKVTKLSVQITNDSLKLIKNVRFHVRAGTGQWLTRDAAINSGRAAVKPNTGRVDWWAELMGDKGSVLITLASEAAPRSEAAPDAPVEAVAASGEGLKEVEFSLEDVPEVLPPGTGLKIGAYVSWAATLVTAGLGIYFGLDSVKDANMLTDGLKAVDSMGRVNGITQAAAYDLERSSKQKATMANGLFIGAGAAALLGGALFFFGQRAATAPVAFHFSPDGAGVSFSWALP